MSKIPDIQLPTSLKERLVQGHPWIYRNHVPPGIRLADGAWVRVRCGGWAGYGLWDAEGPIAIRIYSERRIPDQAWIQEQALVAWEARAPLRTAGHTAYRWIFGEGDGLPGLTVDRYNDCAVIQSYSAGADTLIDWLIDALQEIAPLRGVVIRRRSGDADDSDEHDTGNRARRPQSSKVLGDIPRELIVVEHGLRFQADLIGGQKTGLFLDQRENRRFVEQISAGRSVLNCFAYTGGFSLYALRGGANSVVSADIGVGLGRSIEANIALNRLPQAHHRFIAADCFELLTQYAEDRHLFDMVILDPPSFARSKQNRFAAQRAYTRLNATALRCIAHGGLLVSASCTSQVGLEAFKEALAAAGAMAGRRLRIIHEAGQPADHPVPAHFPEGRYLKFVVCQVSEPA